MDESYPEEDEACETPYPGGVANEVKSIFAGEFSEGEEAGDAVEKHTHECDVDVHKKHFCFGRFLFFGLFDGCLL